MIDGKRKMCEQMKRAPVGDRLVSFVSELLSPLLAPYETGCDTLLKGQEGQRVSRLEPVKERLVKLTMKPTLYVDERRRPRSVERTERGRTRGESQSLPGCQSSQQSRGFRVSQVLEDQVEVERSDERIHLPDGRNKRWGPRCESRRE